MTKTNNATQNRFFRRWVKQLFSGLFNRKDRKYMEEIFDKLQDIEDSIEIIARQIARKGNRGE